MFIWRCAAASVASSVSCMTMPLRKGLPGPRGARARVHLVDDVVRPVHVEVEPETEEVLVVGRDDVGGDEMTGRSDATVCRSRSFRARPSAA